jgi:acyl-CoA synthetase (AMP-forming)/AMP-acid ligase II
MAWNYGDILDAVGAQVPPEKACLIHDTKDDTQVVTWGDFNRRTNNLAQRFLNRGAQASDKVAFYLRNCPAYLEGLGACFKARLTHVNVNYRYVDEELWYILDNSDSKIVIYGSEFADHVRALRERLPNVEVWVEVCDGTPEVEFAVSFDELAEIGDGAPLEMPRSGDDMIFLYTGGTTGMPKGVMWAHEDHWLAGTAGATPATNLIPPKSVAEHAANVKAAGGTGVLMPCCPLMHGTGLFTAIGTLAQGGTVVTMGGNSFDPNDAWATVARHKVTSLAIVGDAFAKPLLRALDEEQGRYDISSVVGIISSGVMWSPEVKKGLLRHNPKMVLTDSFGASEAMGFGRSDTTADGTTEVAKFTLGPFCKVFKEDMTEARPGSGEVGFVARTGAIPRGYYKDPEKTAKTFPTIDGVRYSMPGDYCRVEADGTLTLLGRGSVCINTAGEKVYPEEVEEVLKAHEAVHDALVVGVPDEKWGQMVTAVIQMETGANVDEEALREFVRKRLAGYKTPKRIIPIENIGRASNGKADYKGVTAYAKKQLGIA